MTKDSGRNVTLRSPWTLSAVALAGALLLGLALPLRFGTLTEDRLDLPPGTHVWAHRGTHGGYLGEGREMNRSGENTLDAFAASMANGFTGVELDIHFLGARGFIVKHDEPTREDHLRLEEVFARCGRKLFYWLDFKNLDDKNVDNVIIAFRRIFDQFPVLDRVVIESGEARPLAKLKNAIPGLRALYWIQSYPSGRGILNSIQRARQRMTVAWFGYRNVSASTYVASVARPRFLRDFARLGKYVYTVNDPARMAALRDAGVRVILTDRDELPPEIGP